MTIKAILFDKDGTLLDFDATYGPATAKVLAELAADIPDQIARLANAVEFDLSTTNIAPGSVLIAGSVDNIAEALLPFMGNINLSDATAKIDALYEKYSLESLTPFSFLNTTLDQLTAMGMDLGIATNDSESAARAHLDKIGITQRFCYLAGFDSGHGEKPGPGMVSAFIDQLELPPHQVMMVGDSAHDCTAGRAAGAIAVAVTSGGATAEALAPHADHVATSIADLPQLIRQRG